MPLFRFVSATDPKYLATLDTIRAHLVHDGPVQRYIAEETPTNPWMAKQALPPTRFGMWNALRATGIWGKRALNLKSCYTTPIRLVCMRRSLTVVAMLSAIRRRR